MPRPRRFAARVAPGLLLASSAAGLAGCGATGATLASDPAAAANSPAVAKAAWYSPRRLLAAVDPARSVGLSDDDLVPATRGDLRNPAALDLAYADLQTAGGAEGADAAEVAYRRVLEDDPGNVQALIGLARLIETNAGDRPNELTEAGEAYARAVAAAPGDARPHAALGRFHAGRGRWGDSAAAFGRAVETAANTKQRREAYFGLAVATARGGNVAASRPHFVAAVGEASAHYNVGMLLFDAGDRAGAEAEFRLAVAKDRGDNPQLRKAYAALAALTSGRETRHIAAAEPAVPAAALTPAAAVAAHAAPAAVAPAVALTPAAPPVSFTPGSTGVMMPGPPQSLPPFGSVTGEPAAPAAPAPASDDPPPWPF